MALVVADAGAVKSSKVASALESLQEAMKEEVSFAKPWHSLCSSKVRWSQPNVEELALHFIRSVPPEYGGVSEGRQVLRKGIWGASAPQQREMVWGAAAPYRGGRKLTRNEKL